MAGHTPQVSRPGLHRGGLADRGGYGGEFEVACGEAVGAAEGGVVFCKLHCQRAQFNGKGQERGQKGENLYPAITGTGPAKTLLAGWPPTVRISPTAAGCSLPRRTLVSVGRRKAGGRMGIAVR